MSENTSTKARPRRRSSTPWTEVLAMTSLEIADQSTDSAIEDEPAFDPETPRDMGRYVVHLAVLWALS